MCPLHCMPRRRKASRPVEHHSTSHEIRAQAHRHKFPCATTKKNSSLHALPGRDGAKSSHISARTNSASTLPASIPRRRTDADERGEQTSCMISVLSRRACSKSWTEAATVTAIGNTIRRKRADPTQRIAASSGTPSGSVIHGRSRPLQRPVRSCRSASVPWSCRASLRASEFAFEEFIR